ncbi:MAG TPA: maleylpyruvate isomerase family mycothiol-dependent enzyme [Mycobacteriales bacterium]|nr:maleylpyruvate isomerase family mycothiol-dependent enzyme [Mycobacteriales bacterium]
MDIHLDPPKAILQLSRDAPALVAAGRRAGLDAIVPSCPGWTVADLVGHVGGGYAHKATIVRERLRDPPEPEATPPGGEAVFGWFDEQLADLLGALKSTPADTALWTWFPREQNARFWSRRMAHETVIHRADAELATGEPHHVDALVAVDGIDEFLERMLGFWGEGDPSLADRTMAVVTPGASWRMTGRSDGLDFERDPTGAAGATVAGTPSHVLYWLWGRLGDEAVDLRGDLDLIAAMRRQMAAAAE